MLRDIQIFTMDVSPLQRRLPPPYTLKAAADPHLSLSHPPPPPSLPQQSASLEDLSRASFGGNLELVKSLLASGVPASARDTTGLTALHRAAIGGQAAVCSELLRAGASVHEKDSYGDTALHYAAFCGFEEVLRVLLDAGADANAVGADGRTPLAAAEEEGQSSVAALLAARGGTAGSSAAGGSSSGSSSARSSSSPAAAAPVDEEASKRAVRALCDASFSGDVKTMHELLALRSADVNSCDAEGATPLHRAAACGSLPAIELLLGHGADVGAVDSAQCSPLHYAAFCGHTDCVHVLLAAGSDASARTKDGLTPADLAAAERRTGALRLLSGSYTRVEGLDLSHGIVMEGKLLGRRSPESFGAMLWRWKPKYAVLSRTHRALLMWSGGQLGSTGSHVLRLACESMEGAVQAQPGVSAQAGWGQSWACWAEQSRAEHWLPPARGRHALAPS
jgi:ankyrin repeat protein